MSEHSIDDNVRVCETTPYDPRYERGQSVEDARSRYLHQDGYTMERFEEDLERLLNTETNDE